MRAAAAVMVLGLALLPASARAAKPPKKTPQLLETGRVAYRLSCAHCHGEEGRGDGPAAAGLEPRPRDFTSQPFRNGAGVAQVFGTIGKGVPGTGMASFAELSDEERWGLAYYVLELRAHGKPPAR